MWDFKRGQNTSNFFIIKVEENYNPKLSKMVIELTGEQIVRKNWI